jgi:hypothetical protein
MIALSGILNPSNLQPPTSPINVLRQAEHISNKSEVLTHLL